MESISVVKCLENPCQIFTNRWQIEKEKNQGQIEKERNQVKMA